ncbi:Glycosyl transferase, family 8 [Kalmanozyma brasiliensis GHG001]|uniref:Glycosyl transferase, family 8 n=1 Tax=Kalmanozyma brasiliensis (strain GHG001) TaxID=1365824 RepID=UPI002867EF5A|nr:Glycosyl transferase, family 8 [Kalmanozyma brasiliensis GHG001]KAF6767378.1 Glycosyl transferase, family 8 [Kalmanozyma brasiliensis GHG001]
MAAKSSSVEYVPLQPKEQHVEVVFDSTQEQGLDAQTRYSRPNAPPDSSTKRHLRRLGWQRVALILALLLGGCALVVHWLLPTRPIASSSKYAFVTLLSASPSTFKHEANNATAIYDDTYFIATRMLGYQLMHDPQTKTHLGAPFIVMTTPQVHPAKIERLKKDGAIVWPITEPLRPPLYSSNQNRYPDVFSKLLLWKWTQFERILFLDNDHVLNHRMDTIFQEPQVAQLRHNRGNQSAVLADEGAQPSDYVFAPIPESGHVHSGVNAGFFVLKPDMAMWNYFQSVLAVPGKFDPVYPEQNFQQYVFRQDGNMPFHFLDRRWSHFRPQRRRVEGGHVFALQVVGSQGIFLQRESCSRHPTLDAFLAVEDARLLRGHGRRRR